MLRAARWKCRTQKIAKKSLSGHHRTTKLCTMSGPYLWAGRLYIHFRRLLLRNGILPGAKFTLFPPSLALCYIGSVTARQSSSGREPKFAALSTGRHLYSAGRPSRWALDHIVVSFLWPPYIIGGPLYFCPVISIFYLSSIFLWSPYVIGQTIIFSSCSFFLLSIFFLA